MKIKIKNVDDSKEMVHGAYFILLSSLLIVQMCIFFSL